MAKGPSASQKLQRAAYSAGSRRTLNKEAKVARHVKKNPNDLQSATRAKSTCSGKSHEVRSPFIAKVRRSLRTGAFGNLQNVSTPITSKLVKPSVGTIAAAVSAA